MDAPEIIVKPERKYALWKPISKALPRNHTVFGAFEKKVEDLATKAVADSGTTSPIVPQPLSPEVIPIFVSKFPLFDLLEKVPSNGLSHTYQQQTAFTQTTDPNTISEAGTVNDDTNSYVRQTSNVAVFAIRRGVTLKGQYAGQNAGGPASDLMGRELRGGLLTISRDAQKETLRYQDVDNASTTSTAPNGKYDADGFNGMRWTMANRVPAANTIAVDIRTPWTDQRVLKAVRKGVNQVWDLGGEIDLLIANTTGSEAMFEDQVDLVRYVRNDQVEIAPGLVVRAIQTDQGLIPVLVVPGDAIGTYTDGVNTFQDIIGINTETIAMPYLGNPEPSVLRIPLGVDGTLRELAIPFSMLGLACEAPQYMFRVKLEIA